MVSSLLVVSNYSGNEKFYYRNYFNLKLKSELMAFNFEGSQMKWQVAHESLRMNFVGYS